MFSFLINYVDTSNFSLFSSKSIWSHRFWQFYHKLVNVSYWWKYMQYQQWQSSLQRLIPERDYQVDVIKYFYDCWKYTLKTLSALTIWFWLYLQNQMVCLGSQIEQLFENCRFANLLNVRIFFFRAGCSNSEKPELYASRDVVLMGSWILATSPFPFRAIWNISSPFTYDTATTMWFIFSKKWRSGLRSTAGRRQTSIIL